MVVPILNHSGKGEEPKPSDIIRNVDDFFASAGSTEWLFSFDMEA